VVNITIEQARAYARWSHRRLPTPLEWERAARGKDGALFPWGDAEDPSRANVSNNSNLARHALMPVRSFGAYPAFQMIGNAWEIVEGETASGVAIRGGSCLTPLSGNLAYDSMTIPAAAAAGDIGFRCVKDP
jgi:formylglycine-generating enzyme required for sulfatase activity